jgi:hypothetical protein
MALWAATRVTPEVNKITVLANGNINGSSASIPTGGQIAPTATDGDKLEWKNAQKNGKNNIASDNKNKVIPYSNPD